MAVFTRKRTDRAGLFDNLKGKGIEDTLEVPVAVMAPMVVMMWADKKKHEAETELIHAICRSSPIFLRPTERQIEQWIDECEQLIKQCGEDDEKVCKRAVASMSKPHRQTAFAFAIQILFADEKVTGEEKVQADQLADWLGIDRTLAGEITKVISILRHGRDVS